MTHARKALMAKIKKCLALSQSANEHEASLALEKARALMAEHGVSDEELQLAEVGEAFARGGGAQRPAAWESVLASAVARALDCRPIYVGEELADQWKTVWRWEFVGIGAAPTIAAYAFPVLFRQLRRQRQAYIDTALRRCKPARKRQRADIFCEAWATAVYRQVQALKPTREHAGLIDNWLATRGRELVTLNSREAFTGTISGARADDYWRGAAAGRKAKLNAGLGGAAAPALIG